MLPFSNNNASRVLVYLKRNREIEKKELLMFRTLLFLWNVWLCGERCIWFVFLPDFNPFTFNVFIQKLEETIPLIPEIQALELSSKCLYFAEMTGYSNALWERILFVSARVGITEKLLDTYSSPPHSPIRQANVEIWAPAFSPKPWFMAYGKNGEPLYKLEYKPLADGSCTVLPIRYFINSACIFDRFSGPEIPVDFVNGEHKAKSRISYLMNLNLIHARPNATVELDSDLSLAVSCPCDAERIFSSWYGEWETWESIDLSVLNGHAIVLSCYDRPEEPENTGFRNAVSMLNRLRDHDRSVKVEVHDEIKWENNPCFCQCKGTAARTQLLSIQEFIREASRRGVDCSALEDCHELRSLSAEELIKIPAEEYILYPILKPATYNLIYGASGVAKTWFALHLALSLSLGCSPYPKWDFRGNALKVIYFAGEMSEGIYGERIAALLAGRKLNGNFHLIRETLDMAAEEDQKRIMKTIAANGAQIVFFDNLVTLSTNGHTDGQFGMIQKLFNSLKSRGISIYLVHHENREGGFKGTAKIEQVADQSIHLLQSGNGSRIELLVKPEKIRNTARSEQPSFRTEFDPKEPVVPWPMFKPTKEELLRLDEDDPLDEIGRNAGKRRNNHQLAWNYMLEDAKATAIIDDMLSGCMDDVIAANLVVREKALVAFKEDHGISEDALKEFMPDAVKKAEKQFGKVTTAEFAAVIWDLIQKKKRVAK